jgi:hypothetical protein
MARTKGPREWPPGDVPAAFEDIIDPLRKMLSSAYRMRLKPGIMRDGIPYTALESTVAAHVSGKGSEMVTPDSLAYHRERGRDPATVLLIIAAWLGMEQGRRSFLEKHRLTLRVASAYINEARRRDPGTGNGLATCMEHIFGPDWDRGPPQ